MRIARVFPRRTKATPTDELAFVGFPPSLFPPEVDAVHISVTFTDDLTLAEILAREWKHIAPVETGGPATGMRGEEFVPGRYLKQGYVITSRGCPNRCWFCFVWKREGDVRELPINDGYNVLDDNLLACSPEHVKAVFDMLRQQKKPAEFTGGLEAARLQEWHVNELSTMRIKQMFFAYDTPDDYEPLLLAGRLLREAGFTQASHVLRCYVLIGHPRDTLWEAEERLHQTINAGFMPMAMLWRGDNTPVDRDWKQLQREYARPSIVGTKITPGSRDNR